MYLGFSTAPSEGGDFTPIVKYDARAGRMFRMDRIENNGNFANEAVDITQSFKAIVDFENMRNRLDALRFRHCAGLQAGADWQGVS